MAARPKIMQSLTFFFATIIVLIYYIWYLWSSTLGADPNTGFSIGMYGKEPGERSCDGKQVYIYELPAEYNKDLVTSFLEKYPTITFANDGLGDPYLSEIEGSVLQNLTSFYTTSEYAIEYLYHMRLQRSHCRVTDPSLADLFYAPFYPSLEWKLKEGKPKDEVDRLGIQLAKYMRSQKWFHKRAGKDHFMVKGLSYWTWYRSDLLGEVWGTNLEQLPEISKMYKVEVERDEWGPTSYHSSSVPYPTAFHPRTDADVLLWQERVRASQRSANFSFMDFRVLDKDEREVHFHVRQQCDESTSCELRESPAAGYSLEDTMEVNMRSVFSVQLKGAAHTTRAFFDALLCGAIPVVLWGHTMTPTSTPFTSPMTS
eukprot:jgi/Mesen1/8710/ME000052S08138